MGASPLQYDLQAGLDISGLSSLTKAQLIQLFSQIAPLTNIGGVVVLNSGGGTSWPGISNNPRFKRYLWLDTFNTGSGAIAPTLRFHNQTNDDTYASWVSIGTSLLSITNSMIANKTITLEKLVPSVGANRFLVRVSADGTQLEFINPNAIFATGDVPIAAIDATGATAGITSYLKVDSTGAIKWEDPRSSDYNTLFNPLGISPGSTSGKILVTGLSGGVNVPAWGTLDDVLPNAAYGEHIFFNGTNWINYGPILVPNAADLAAAPTLPTTETTITTAHTLGVIPRMWRVNLVCTTNDAPCLAGEEYGVEGLCGSTGGDAYAGIYGFRVDASNVYVYSVVKGANVYTIRGVITGLTPANWKFRFYLWP